MAGLRGRPSLACKGGCGGIGTVIRCRERVVVPIVGKPVPVHAPFLRTRPRMYTTAPHHHARVLTTNDGAFQPSVGPRMGRSRPVSGRSRRDRSRDDIL